MQERLHAASIPPEPRRSLHPIMHKILAIAFVAAALAACSSMSGTQSMGNSGNPAETKNSTDANRAGNPAAVSPGTGTR